MRIWILFAVGLLLPMATSQLLAGSNSDRNWRVARVREIHRTPNLDGNGDHWEYLLISDGFAYTVRNGGHDSPYLNSSLNTDVKIGSSINGSANPFDGEDVYVLDVKGQEHRMGLVSVLAAEDPCKK